MLSKTLTLEKKNREISNKFAVFCSKQLTKHLIQIKNFDVVIDVDQNRCNNV